MSEGEAGKLGQLGDAGCVGEDRRGYYVRFSVPKQNYGNVIPDRWFKRDEGGVLLPVELWAEKSEREPRPGRQKASAAGKATIQGWGVYPHRTTARKDRIAQFGAIQPPNILNAHQRR